MLASRFCLAVSAAAGIDSSAALSHVCTDVGKCAALPARVLFQQSSNMSSTKNLAEVENQNSEHFGARSAKGRAMLAGEVSNDVWETDEDYSADEDDEDSDNGNDAEDYDVAAAIALAQSGEEDSADSVAAEETEDLKPKQKSAKRKKRAKRVEKGKNALEKTMGQSLIRPNFGHGPEKIEVEILVKNFMGITFTSNSFNADIILVSRWKDKRTQKLLSKQHKNSLSLPPSDAKRALWMPDIEIMNREYQGLDVLSSSVQISKNGVVEKIERSHMKLKCSFNTNAFPFDTQTLSVRVASESKMIDEVVLSAIANEDEPGILHGAFKKDDLFSYVKSEIRDYPEKDGPLKKSRAELLITVHRNMAACIETILVPSVCVVTVSWAGFWMPSNVPGFIMPRVTTSFVSFLMQVNLDNRIDHLQPARGDASWLDILQECNELMVYSSVVWNAIIIYASFYHDLQDLASTIDREVCVFLPLVYFLLLLLCYLYVGSTRTAQLAICTRVLLTVIMGSFLCYMITKLGRAIANKPKPVEKLKAPPALPPGPPPAPYARPLAGGSSPYTPAAPAAAAGSGAYAPPPPAPRPAAAGSYPLNSQGISRGQLN